MPENAVAQDTINLQAYTPTFLLRPGQLEIKTFNNLYTQRRAFNQRGRSNPDGRRSSYFSSINEIFYGLTPRLNIGAEMWLQSVHIDDEGSSPFSLLGFPNDDLSRTAVTYLGPRVKFLPFKKAPHFSVQSAFLFPVAPDLEGAQNNKPFLAWDRYLWMNRFFYDRKLSPKFLLFVELAGWLSIDRHFEKEGTFFESPLSVFVSYFPTPRLTFYSSNQFWPSYGEGVFSSYFYQAGGGVKYQIIPGKFEVEGLVTKFVAGKNAGAGSTFNIGFRLLQ